METIQWLGRNLDDLVAFHAVATEGSFTRSAEKLATSKSKLSKQVQRMETMLGTQLLVRTTRSLQVTEAGKMLLEYTRRITDLSAEAAARLEGMKSGAFGRIRISAPISLGRWCYPALVRFVRDRFPGVVLDTDASNEPIDFRTDEIDFAIRGIEVEDPELIARYLGKLKDVIVATPKVARTVDPKDPRKLAELNCIRSSLVTEWNTWTLVSKEREIRVEVRGTLAANEYMNAKDYALAGFGVARLPVHAVAEEIRSGKLVRLFESYSIATHPLYLVYRKGNYQPAYHREIREWLMKWFKAHRDAFL